MTEIMTKDLNLLRVFVTVGETLNLSKASKVLNLSQPALSYSLKKLREDFADPLFVRGSYGFQPTARALELLPKAKELLVSAQSLYAEQVFDLKTHQQKLVLAATSYFEAIAIVKLLKVLEKEAPLVSLQTISLQGDFPKRELESGEIDLAVAAYFGEVPDNYYLQTLGRDKHVAVMRTGHPYLRSKQSLEDYLSYSHIKIDVPVNSHSKVDEILQKKKLRRNLVGSFNNFLTPMMVVAETDSILTIPVGLAKIYSKYSELKIVDLPLPESVVEVKMVWHGRSHQDPFHQWFRSQMRSISN